MITKETARRIYNCYSQLENIEQLKKDMAEEVQKVREREAEREKDHFAKPIPENDFGKFGRGMQLGVPDGFSSSMRIFDISPELAIQVMDEHKKTLLKEMDSLKAIANIEMSVDDI